MNALLKGFQGIVDPESQEGQLLSLLAKNLLPRHVAIIMDGNGRWAKKKGLPRVEGHRKGVAAVKSTIEYAARLTLPVLTLYAFSSENWKRPKNEVNTLWRLLRHYLHSDLETLQKNNIRFGSIGRTHELPTLVQRELDKVTSETSSNTGMHLCLALNYSGRAELVDTFNTLLKSKRTMPIRGRDIEEHLYTSGVPDPDLLIRTGGNMRISNFLLWQIAYSEIYVTDTLWPDFRGMDLVKAFLEFQKRERRYGGVESSSGVIDD
jgi:undecaprenyl diphosphate synthase